MTLIDDRPDTPVDPIVSTAAALDAIGPDTVVPGETGLLSVMDGSGDTPVKWRVGNRDEEQIARAAFDKAKDRGYLAYRVDPDDHSKGEIMREFDPKAGEVILAPQPVGG